MGCCVGKVYTYTDAEYNVENFMTYPLPTIDYIYPYLIYLPTEMLLNILRYLPIRDRVTMRHVSRRLKDISQTPSLWKEFVWPDYEPRHVRQVSGTLRTCGEHVRRILFPAHVCTAPLNVLEMACCCTKVIHLSLSKTTELSLDHVEEILCIMPHLQQLDLCIDGRYMVCTRYLLHNKEFLEGLLELTAGRVRKLKLQINNYDNSVCPISKLKRWVKKGNPLPSLIDIFTTVHSAVHSAVHDKGFITNFLVFWSESSSELLPCEINLYSNKRIPMNLHSPMPIYTFQSGPAATPPLIRLSDYGIMGLGIFCIGKYDHNGTVRYTISPAGGLICTDQYSAVERVPHVALANKQLYNDCTDILLALSYVDMSYSKVQCNNLEQLAILCPNLQRLNLKGNGECLAYLGGLSSIVHTCQNLEGLNLAGIQLFSVESSLVGLWELLSSIKKLTHLAIDLCMLTYYDNDHRRCLINMFKRCHSLKALELHCSKWCSKCMSEQDFLFSHFPSLTHCRMSNFVYSGFKYAITNCHMLKYLYETDACEEFDEKLFPFTSICPLQQLYVDATYFNVTNELACALSAHGGLECVVLHVNTITIDSIIILIKYSPNLVLLNVGSKQILFDENCKQEHLDYKDYIMKKFSYHKLFTIGSFTVHIAGNSSAHSFNTDLDSSAHFFNTDLNSLWV